MGTARAVNAIHIQWVNPYATIYVVQYWLGDNNAMDWDMGPNGSWKAFQSGAVLNRSGGDVHLKLSDAPVTTRFVPVFRCRNPPEPATLTARKTFETASATHSERCPQVQSIAPEIPRSCLSSERRRARTWEAAHTWRALGNQEVIAGSEADLAGSFFASSIDPWHQADNLITGGSNRIQRHGQFLYKWINHGASGAGCMCCDYEHRPKIAPMKFPTFTSVAIQ